MRHLCFSPVWTVTSGETSDAMDWNSLLLQVFSAGLRIPLQRLHFLWPSQLLPLLLSLPCLKGNGWEERLAVNFKIRKATSRQLYSTLQHMEKVAGEQAMDLVCSSKSSSVPSASSMMLPREAPKSPTSMSPSWLHLHTVWQKQRLPAPDHMQELERLSFCFTPVMCDFPNQSTCLTPFACWNLAHRSYTSLGAWTGNCFESVRDGLRAHQAWTLW